LQKVGEAIMTILLFFAFLKIDYVADFDPKNPPENARNVTLLFKPD
jgi:hypothetical protein